MNGANLRKSDFAFSVSFQKEQNEERREPEKEEKGLEKKKKEKVAVDLKSFRSGDLPSKNLSHKSKGERMKKGGETYMQNSIGNG